MAMKDLIPWKRGEKKVPVKRENGDFYSLSQEMDRFFDDFFNRGFSLSPWSAFDEDFGSFSPQLDMTENDQEIKVEVELPGMDEKDVELSLARNTLTIKGEKRTEQEDKGDNYYRMERSYGSFHRSILLPAEIEADKVEAVFNKGVLTVTLPKTKEAQKRVKRISVKSA
jgi:HSP20 family protein